MKDELTSIPSSVEKLLGLIDLDALAKGLFQRRRKVAPRQWCLALCAAAMGPGCSLATLAACLGACSGRIVSRVAALKRLRGGGLEVLQRACAAAVCAKAGFHAGGGPLARFARVIVQDSTTLALPLALFEAFPGSTNHRGSTASMRVQTFLELKSELFLGFGVSSYRRNDQKASADVLRIAREGDLIVRDLGYFSLEVIAALIAIKASVLTRLRRNTVVSDPDTGSRIDLLARLRGAGRLDARVLVGEKARVPMRLVAEPVPEPVANERRRKARLAARRDRRMRLSKADLALLGWTILLTDCDAQRLPATQMLELYAARWRVETVFKSWKSSLGMEAIPPRASAPMAEAIVLARLLIAVAMHGVILQHLRGSGSSGRPHVSVLMLAKLVALLPLLEQLADIGGCPQAVLENLDRHARYGKRKKPNQMQRWDSLS